MTITATTKKLISNARYLFSVKKPIVVFRYLTKFLQSKLTGTISPRQIDIALTFDCNLKCDHCFSFPLLNKNESEMSYKTLKYVADQCLDMGITVIHFTGGEILMRDDLEDVIRLFHPGKNIIYIQSNGTLASYDRLKSLKQAGLDFFGVSLEQADKKKQDQFRHFDGYFDTALQSLEFAKQAGLQTSVNITIDNTLIHSPALPALIEHLGDLGHIVYGNLPVPVGRFKEKKELLWLGEERKKLLDLTRRYLHFRTEFDSNFGPYGCPAMKEKMYLCAYGDVLSCPYIHVSFGNVNDTALNDIYKTSMEFEVINQYHDHCLAAENQNFIDTVIEKTHEFSRQPVFYKHLVNELHTFDKPGTQTMKPSAQRNLPLDLETVKCEVCGSNDSEPFVSARDYETEYSNIFNVVKCRKCSFIFSSPRPSMDDLFTHFYADNYVCYKSSGAADTIREEYLCKSRFRELKQILPEGGRFLDVGCSYGYFLEYLQNNTTWDAYGCEPNTEMAATASLKGLSVKPATLIEANYESGYFDMVYMSHVLEHIPDLKQTVDEVFRILKPGGVFLTENPDLDAPTRELFGRCWWGYHLPRHLTHFTHESITRLLTDSGFTVERITPCFRPGPIAWSFQNILKEKNYPKFMTSLFGVDNPFFVAFMSLPTLLHMRKGHTDMMETLGRKPER